MSRPMSDGFIADAMTGSEMLADGAADWQPIAAEAAVDALIAIAIELREMRRLVDEIRGDAQS